MINLCPFCGRYNIRDIGNILWKYACVSSTCENLKFRISSNAFLEPKKAKKNWQLKMIRALL